MKKNKDYKHKIHYRSFNWREAEGGNQRDAQGGPQDTAKVPLLKLSGG